MTSATKPWWTSKTIVANVIGIVFLVLGNFGIIPAGLTEAHVVEMAMGAINILSIIFRWGADTPVSLTK